jgi:hypothetical protein
MTAARDSTQNGHVASEGVQVIIDHFVRGNGNVVAAACLSRQRRRRLPERNDEHGCSRKHPEQANGMYVEAWLFVFDSFRRGGCQIVPVHPDRHR